MNILIVYDSLYGNTESIAHAISNTIGTPAKVIRPDDVERDDLQACTTLIVGSPTQGGRPTKALQQFLDEIPDGGLDHVGVAAFDTRFSAKWVKVFGYAADKIAANLETKGGRLIVEPACFLVKKEKGPLEDGELERASAWAKEIADIV